MDKNKVVIGVIVALLVMAIGIGLVLNQGSKDDVITIGAILPLTGNSSDLGESTRRGIELCLENWNEKGGVLDKKLVAVFLDSKSEPREGRTLANKLLSENNPLLVYTLISGVALNVKEVLEENGVLHIATIGSSNLFDGQSNHTLRNYVSPTALGPEVMNTLINTFERKELIVFYINNEFGLSYRNSVVNAAAKNSVSMKAIIPYEESSLDYRNVILNARLQSGDVLYVQGIGASIGRMIRQIRESGFDGIILCDANLLNASAIALAGQTLQNVHVLDFYRGEERADYRLVAEQFRQKYNSEIDVFTLLAYQGVDIVLRFIEANQIAEFHNLAEQMEGFQIDSIMGEIKVQGNEIIYPLQLTEALR